MQCFCHLSGETIKSHHLKQFLTLIWKEKLNVYLENYASEMKRHGVFKTLELCMHKKKKIWLECVYF